MSESARALVSEIASYGMPGEDGVVVIPSDFAAGTLKNLIRRARAISWEATTDDAARELHAAISHGRRERSAQLHGRRA